MTKLLEQAFEMLERMPADAQDGIARTLLDMDQVFDLDEVEPEHRAAVAEGMAQASRGEFAAGSASEIVADAFRWHRR